MAETRREQSTRRLARRAAGRLAHHRWTLIAATLAVFAVHLFADGSWLFAAAAILVVLVVTALSPRRSRAQRQAEQSVETAGGGLDGLTAQHLASAVGDPLIIFDANGAVAHANSAAQSAFGLISPGLSLLLKFRAPEMQGAIEAVRSGNAVSSVVDYVERVPIERVYKVSAAAVGRGTGLFVLVFKDQSETRRIDRMRADFIANASHELRTPLASISGFIETLRGPARNDAAARDQFLQIMQNQTARMARLIDDLLSLSRLEMKSYLAPGATVDVRAIVQGVIDSLTPLAKESGVEIEKRFGEEPVEVRGDRDELFQVFENLLENACKYGQTGGRVTVSIEAADSAFAPGIDVTVRDYGPGIPEEHIPRITERFYRVDVDTSRAQKGTGLGLAIVKHILTRHNARLSIKSALGEGAAFTVHFPSS